MSRRMKITLPETIAAQLDDLAANTGEPAARLAGQMVRAGIAEAAASGHIRPPRAQPAPVLPHTAEAEDPDRRAQWIEPIGGDPHWRVWMWGSIVALHGRYPTELAHLKDGWWDNTSHVEALCALVVWRDWIDTTADDPRHELAFHHQLTDYGRELHQEGGSIERTWKPGAPPDGWIY
jgi:hypothetical protein